MGRRSVLGDGFGTFTDGVFGQFSWKHEADRSLDFTTGKSFFTRVAGKTDGFGSNALKGVVDKRVHDGHGFSGDACVRVDLFEDLVDV